MRLVRIILTTQLATYYTNPLIISAGDNSSTDSGRFNVGSLSLIIQEGNIIKETADAVVNSTDEQLDLSSGRFTSKLQHPKMCIPNVSSINQYTSFKIYSRPTPGSTGVLGRGLIMMLDTC